MNERALLERKSAWAGTQNARAKRTEERVMDAMPFADNLANIVSADAFTPFTALASIVALTWAMLGCARRETLPAVWILAADFHYVEIDLVETARQI
jgi:hypothetical protein